MLFLDNMMDGKYGNNCLPFISCSFDKFHYVCNGATVYVLVDVRRTGLGWIDDYSNQARANVFNDGPHENLQVHKLHKDTHIVHTVYPKCA